MREARIRREPGGWIAVERINWIDIHDKVSIKPTYHMNLGAALWQAFLWIWRQK